MYAINPYVTAIFQLCICDGHADRYRYAGLWYLQALCLTRMMKTARHLTNKLWQNTWPIKPYEDIPHTAAIDPMEDNLRNRLLMFTGKFSDEYVANEKTGKASSPVNRSAIS